MSKTFKSAVSSGKDLLVRQSDGHVALFIRIPDLSDRDIHVDPSDAPALALAILEAAGVAESSDEGVAAQYLRASIAEQERAAAAAKEQAELEAEGYGLYRAWAESFGESTFADSLDDMHQIAKDQWLAVAAKAREIAGRAEK